MPDSRKMIRIVRAIAWLPVGMGLLWAFGALWFDFPVAGAGHPVAILFALGVIALLIFMRPVSRVQSLAAASVLVILAGWWLIPPRQDRDWKPEVAKLPYAEIADEIVTVHGVRNFEYRSETDFTPRYEDRRYDLRKLRGIDLFVNYWGSPYMAHPIVSFDFGTDGRICFSIETRPEKGESYSALGGLYRQFELIYIAADERDVIGVRANHRTGEDVYLYRLKAKHPREAFLEYIRVINGLKAKPRWYNAITTNCTTAIREQRTAAERAPWDWRMLVNGYADEWLYERKAIDTSMPFPELKRLSHVNAKAKEAAGAEDFSERIRQGLPR